MTQLGQGKRGVRAFVATVALVMVATAAWFTVGWSVARDVAGDVAGDVAVPPVTVTSTVTSTVTVPARAFAEDSLPDEMNRWIDDHPGSRLDGPSYADRLSAGHHGCYMASTVDGTSGLLMCPGNYRIEW